MQIETVRRAMQSIQERRGFLLGDATGVGKGRTIAAIVLEYAAAHDQHLRVAWVSASIRLEPEARAEIETVGADGSCMIFESYCGMQNTTNEARLIEWLSQGAALLILDECHLLRNEKSIAATTFDRVTRCVPNLDIVYSSATACSQVRHMAYLGRLGLFGSNESPFQTFDALSRAVRQHGSSLMELLAIDLRSRGAYVARQLSFVDVEVVHRVSAMKVHQRELYDQCVVAMRESPRSGSMQQSFFQRLITAFKVDETIRLTEREIIDGNSVVISLVNTGDAAARRTTAKDIPRTKLPTIDDESDDLLELDLPLNPLDALFLHFGDRMVELTGRRHRFLQNSGQIKTVPNPSLRDQAELFTSGQRHVAVLSRAGGTGISLHDATDGRRRVHIILEIPWSAEDMLQQMGRTHRSNSRRPPKYILVSSDVPAEKRFASSLVQKLQSFGALVKADRSSCTFSFLRVPKWNPAEKRSISLYLSMAEALREKDAPPQITRQQAIAACGLEKRAGDAAMKTRVAQMLRCHEELGDRRVTVVAAALRLYPNDTTLLVERWGIHNHRLFPHAFKEQVFTLMMCAQSLEASGTLGLLSKDLLFYIIEWIACPIALSQAKMVAQRMHASGLANLPIMSMDHILNRVLGIELGVQEDLFRVADALVHPEKKTSSADILRYATERAGNCIRATIRDVSFCRFDGAVEGVRVEIQYVVEEARSPPLGARFLRHSSGNRFAWFCNGLVVFHDGTEMRLDDETQMRARDFYQSSLKEWKHAADRVVVIAKRRARRLPVYFHLATRYALRNWEMSAKKVLRVPPTLRFPQGLIGLLMHRV
jgi:hypothetical protein